MRPALRATLCKNYANRLVCTSISYGLRLYLPAPQADRVVGGRCIGVCHMKLFPAVLAVISLPFGAVAVQAEDALTSPFTVTGSTTIASDYRLRGVSQTNREMAVQGGLTIAHESGFYVGTWASNLAGWGTFGGANMELDLIGGYKTKLTDAVTLDAGLTWYMYPGGADKTDYAEPYVKLSGTVGPATLLAGVAYAPRQQALGRWYFTGADAAAGVYNDPGAKHDNLYLWSDAALPITGTPLTAKAHLGWSKGNKGLGPNATSAAPTGQYWDWSVGMDASWRNLTLNLSYVGTDISNRDAAYLRPSFSDGQDGTGNIAGGTVLASLTASF